MVTLPRLRLLGGASIDGPDGPIGGRAAQRHRLALLALLALEPRGLGRDRIVALLWPERSDTRGRHALSDSVYRINRALGADAVVAVGDRELRLDPAVLGSDVHAFRLAVDAEDWEGALAAYGGPFLDAFHLSGCVDFDQWADVVRRRLEQTHADALESLAGLRARQGDGAGCIAAWTLRANLDPYSSRVAVELMRALDARGNPAAALRHAEEHVDLLARELGTTPPPEVEAEAVRIRSGENSGHDLRGLSGSVPAGSSAGSPAHQPVLLEAPPASPPVDLGPASTRSAGAASARWGVFAGVGALAGIAFAGALLSGPTASAETGSALETGASIPSLAILPFENPGSTYPTPWMGEGTAEEIAFALGGVRELRVVSTHSSFAIGRELADVRQISDTLGTTWILDGTVHSEGDSVWVAVSLIDGESGHRAWGETFAAEAVPEGRRSMHARIARAVAASLSREVRDGGEGPGEVFPDGDTYEDYLEARSRIREAQSGSVSDMGAVIPQAVALLERVARRAPEWADGWASLGEAYHWSAFAGLDGGEHWVASREALQQALSLDPDHPQAHASLGYVLIRLSRDHELAERHFMRALQLDGDQYWHCGYPNFLFWVGRYDEAVDATRRAEEADPLYPPTTSLRATAHRCAGDPEGAILHAERALAATPGAPVPLRDLALALGETGRLSEAMAHLADAPGATGYPALVVSLLLAREGRVEEAATSLASVDLERALRLESSYVSGRLKVAPMQAAVLVALDRSEEAIELLESAVARDPETLLYDRCFVELHTLESDPRYQALLRHTGIPGW